MVNTISGLAIGSAGFKLTGEITKEDYDKVILPEVKRATILFPVINVVLVIDTDLSNFTAGAWMMDAVLALKTFAKLGRVALVSNSDALKGAAAMADKFIPGEYKYYPLAQEGLARAWVSGE